MEDLLKNWFLDKYIPNERAGGEGPVWDALYDELDQRTEALFKSFNPEQFKLFCRYREVDARLTQMMNANIFSEGFYFARNVLTRPADSGPKCRD